jgi:hypothetical protein
MARKIAAKRKVARAPKAKCPICQSDRPGGRGDLCIRCRKLVSLFGGNPKLMEAAATYLETWHRRKQRLLALAPDAATKAKKPKR